MNIKLYILKLKPKNMFWNKKEDKEDLPDLPPMKVPPRSPFDIPKFEHHDSDDEDDESPVESHSLPAFPDSPMQKSFSQTAIKDAISQPISESSEEPEEEPISEKISSIKTTEMGAPPMMETKPFRLEEPPQVNYVPPKKPTQKANEIFVKVDHFNAAHKSITTIKKKIEDIDSALKKIREIKMREDQELTAWEKEISSLKSRLQEVNDTLFT